MGDTKKYEIRIDMKKGTFSSSRRIVIPAEAVKIMEISPDDKMLEAELDLKTKKLTIWKKKEKSGSSI
jgi:hypothetical protein